jgi:hypothetical protein
MVIFHSYVKLPEGKPGLNGIYITKKSDDQWISFLLRTSTGTQGLFDGE